MSLHPTFHELNTELVSRLLLEFANQIDPGKIYFTKLELVDCINPTPDILKTVVSDLKSGRYDFFHKVFQLLPEKVSRLQQTIQNMEMKALKVDYTLLLPLAHEKDLFLDWAEDDAAWRQKIEDMIFVQNRSIAYLPSKEQQIRARQAINKWRAQFDVERVLEKDSPLYTKTIYTFFMKAFAQSLDSHTVFFPPSDAKQFVMHVQQRLFGIGVLLRDDFDGLSIIKIVDGSPSAQCEKLLLEDKIIAINGESIIGMSTDQAVELIRGPSGTQVTLTILRTKNQKEDIATVESFEVTLTRKEITLGAEERTRVELKPYGEDMMVSLRLGSFYQDEKSSSYEDLLTHINSLYQQHNVRGIILDLRDNTGGLLSEAVLVSGLFLDRCVVVSVKDSEGTTYHMRNLDAQRVWDGPLVVLVNRASASAAEIVAQSLQDWGRAIVVGDDRTFAKGSFQICSIDTSKEVQINPKGESKITRGRYYTTSGKSPQLVGVASDVEVPSLYRYQKVGEKFLPHPLSEDRIPSSFVDTFRDLPFYQRPFAYSIYKNGKQEPLSLYIEAIPMLQERSKQRILQNEPYRQAIAKWYAVGNDIEGISCFGCSEEIPVHVENDDIQKEETVPDFQLEETWNVLRDLIDFDTQKSSIYLSN